MKGGLKGNFTNHSGKRSCAIQLYHAGEPEQEIMARTGHRSEKAVRKYKRSSDEMLRQVSGVLDPTNNTQGAYTGHRYENTVTQYKKCSNEMLKEIWTFGPKYQFTRTKTSEYCGFRLE